MLLLRFLSFLVLFVLTRSQFTSLASWSVFDTSSVVGTVGWESLVTDGTYVYLIPATSNSGIRHGNFVRVTPSLFNSPSGYTSFPADTVFNARGYDGGCFDGRYLYFAPYFNGTFHGYFIRYDTKSSFSNPASWTPFYAESIDGLTTRGYRGVVCVGQYVYYVPNYNGVSNHGVVVRFDTTLPFNAISSWQAYDASGTGGLDARGFIGAVYDGSRYIYFSPSVNTFVSGIALRFDTTGGFKTGSSWSAYDSSLSTGQKGLTKPIWGGRFVYYTSISVPYIVAYDTQGAFNSPSSWFAYDTSNTNGLNTRGYPSGTFDGRYVYFSHGQYQASFHGFALRYDTQLPFTSGSAWTGFNASGIGGFRTAGHQDALYFNGTVFYPPSYNGQSYNGYFVGYKSDYIPLTTSQITTAQRTTSQQTTALRTTGERTTLFQQTTVLQVTTSQLQTTSEVTTSQLQTTSGVTGETFNFTQTSVFGQSEITPTKRSTVLLAAIIGAVGGVCLLVIFVLLVVLLVRRNKKKSGQAPQEMELNSTNQNRSSHYETLPKDHYASFPEHKPYQVMLKGLSFIPFSNLVISRERKILGQGAFGFVYLATLNGEKVAVKEINGGIVNDSQVESFVKEANLMQSLPPHPNILRLVGVCSSPFCIITEYMEKGDLSKYLSSPTKIDGKLQLMWMINIASGMKHLSDYKIIHRDLAARNCLLDSYLVAKISDFGLSRIANTSNQVYSKSDVGPLKWMSVEAMETKTYSQKSDVWSFGVTCIEILTRDRPYPELDALQAATQVMKGLRPQFPISSDPRLNPIVTSCWAESPDDRPTFQQLVTQLEALK